MRSVMGAAALAALLAPVVGAQAAPVRVYVSGRPVEAMDEAEKKTREKAAGEKKKAAAAARKEVEKRLKARHGKHEKDWPPEAQEEMKAAWRGQSAAEMALAMVKTEGKDVDNLAKLLVANFEYRNKKRPTVEVVSAADQADLAVEVVARRAWTSFPRAAWAVYLKVAPVGLPDPGTFAGKELSEVKVRREDLGPILGRMDVAGYVSTVHLYAAAEPHWIVEVVQQGGSYGDATSAAADVLVAYAEGLATPRETAATGP